MANSVEKAHAALAEVEQIETVDPQLQGMLALFSLGRNQIAGFLPTDPDQLDELLLKGARWALSMRSDDAEPYEVWNRLVDLGDEPAPYSGPAL